MAEITPDSSLAEVINSLDLTSIPEKLHCSTCHGFLLNAYKTSCCEQNICEKCFNTIADHCPMCKHKPFSKDLCRSAKAMRNTIRAYLRNVEKTLGDERSKLNAGQAPPDDNEKADGTIVADAQAEANREVEAGILEASQTRSEDPQPEFATGTADVQPSIEVGSPPDNTRINGVSTSQDDEEGIERQVSVESDGNDDEIEIQVEPSAEDGILDMPQHYDVEEQDQQHDDAAQGISKNGENNLHDNSNGMDSNGFNMQNTMGFNMGMGMDMNMMQQMLNMNNMMSMGMNPMFNGFGGSNGTFNGMNMMGMNFGSNQMLNGWNSQNSNIWQNNNAMNAMGGDFGSQFGSNMSQQGNFYPQQFPNGDFHGYSGRGYGRGRGRGRGFYNRGGRGSFHQQQQNGGYHNTNDQQQYDVQHTQAQVTQPVNGQDDSAKVQANHKEDEAHDQDDFAPGGQDEVQEALGDSDRDLMTKTTESSPKNLIQEVIKPGHDEERHGKEIEESESAQPAALNSAKSEQEKIIPEAYHEDIESMAPPSAPTGPSSRYTDKDYPFRARGHGKYASRGRGSFSASAGYPASPVRSVSQTSITAPSPPAKGVGVVGAPTGPRAMREPSVSKPVQRPAGNSGGFQIIGRASMQPQTSQSRDDDRNRSASPVNSYDDHEADKSSSRRQSKYDKYSDEKNEADLDLEYEYDRSDRDRDRKSKRSRRSDYRDDHEMQDADYEYDSVERKSSQRTNRGEKERSRKEDKYTTSSKHRSSRRHYDDEEVSEYDKDGYGEPAADKHRSSRNGKSSSKHESTRDRERDSHRDRKRDRERDRDRDEERSKEKDDRHRKRSRHDRDREDEYDDPDEDESRHRSRRHKKDHHSSNRRDRDRDTDEADLGLRISGRSNSNRQSTLPTPTSATSSLAPNSNLGPDKDPHTLEREARNRERMLKEQQRREKAALDKRGSTSGVKSSRTTTSGGRRVSYKYEDEVERGMGAADEREKARWL